MKRRALIIVFVLALLVSVFGVAAAAVEAVTVATIDGTPYTTLQAAVTAVNNGEKSGIILLEKDASQENIVVDGNVYVDLNGNNIGSVTVNSGTFYGTDSQTNDFTVEDAEGCGTIGSFTGDVQAAFPPVEDDYGYGYVMIKEGTEASFHYVELRITDMTLRPMNEEKTAYNPSVYYKSAFKGDEVVAANVETFGVALSLVGNPSEVGLNKCGSSVFTGFQAGSEGNPEQDTGTLLEGILQESYSEYGNKRNARMKIHGQAYLQLKNNGGYVFGAAKNRTFEEQLVELNNTVWDSLDATEKDSVVALYNTYAKVMENWEIPKILDRVKPLRVLIVGNSHGIDSMNLLYEVFRNEAPNKKVVFGRLYSSGCSIRKHAQQIGNDFYQYTKINDEIYEAGNGWWTMESKVSMQYALQDEQWDIVVMQEMNRQSGNAQAGTILGSFYQSFNKNDYMKVINHIKENVGPDTKLAWNMVWTNPNEPQYYTPGSSLSYGGGADEAETNAWRNEHATLYPYTGTAPEGYAFDQSYMYQCIVNCAQQYIVDSTEFLGAKYFDIVFPSATVVEYAQDVQGLTQAQVYRDYTHVSDYSRLMVSYLWYAKLMGLNSIDAVNVSQIPAVFGGEGTSKYPLRDNGVGTIDATMQQNIKEAVNWALAHPYELPGNTEN